MKFLIGVLVGVALATVGLTGTAIFVDLQITKFQETIKETIK